MEQNLLPGPLSPKNVLDLVINKQSYNDKW